MTTHGGDGAISSVDAFGVEEGYEDALGKWRQAPPETRRAIVDAMGQPDAEPSVLVTRRGHAQRLSGPAEITLEDGAVLRTNAALPRDLPLGYHMLRYRDSARGIRLIVSPGCCYLPDSLRIWGWSAQLYALRSSRSWGMGDFGDLRRLAQWSAKELGAGILLINPLQASSPVLPQESSPYFPSSRRYRNLLYLRMEEVPGAAELRINLAGLAAVGHALNKERRIDRDAVFKLKMEALQLLWSRFSGDSRFNRFCEEQGEPLKQFAVFCVLIERYNSGWHSWPADYHNPHSTQVARFATDHAERIRFYQWVQWLLDEQLAQAAAEISLMQDLPIGVDPDGADAWAWQDVFANDATVGCPPDEYNTKGQDWGLPPLIPWKLRRAGYEPFVQTIRATLRHAGGLRIDHVMGLFRLFWIPKGGDPSAGTFVRYASDELLAILALESERAKAFIVGEDLGTVEEKARKQLVDACVLSYRLLWFEDDPPAHFPKRALAAVTTHDLPTIAGLWTGSDLDAQRELGLNPNEEGLNRIRGRLAAMTGLSNKAPVDEVIERTYRLLAQSPSVIVSATLDDALAVEERPNMPATTNESWPNWSLPLPESQENLEQSRLALEIAHALKRRSGAQYYGVEADDETEQQCKERNKLRNKRVKSSGPSKGKKKRKK
jgi:4-alpha-glucanotransferase